MPNSLVKKPDVLIVGAGFFGCTLAERFAANGKSVLLLEKRDHIGGNAYSYFDSDTNIEVHKYGSHIFHTNNVNIWNYINQFTSFNTYTHRIKSRTGTKILPVPINLETIELVFERKFEPSDAEAFLESLKIPIPENIDNLESWAKSQVGSELYDLLISGYTLKQWGMDPKYLPSSIIKRLPIRFNYDDRYFTDSFQGMPTEGYEKTFKNMVSNKNIELQLETDYFDVRDRFDAEQLTFYSGPIDRFFDYSKGQLNWRTLDFEYEKIGTQYYQSNAIINYASIDVPFTRVHEFKHFYPEREQSASSTIISREFSRKAYPEDEPYYPVGTTSDQEALKQYRILANKLPNIYFGGRLGSYQYLDMHMAINQALIVFEEVMKDRWTTQ